MLKPLEKYVKKISAKCQRDLQMMSKRSELSETCQKDVQNMLN